MTRILALALLLATPALAHDFWIEASDFAPEKGERVELRLLNGERLEGQAVAWDPARVARFVVRGGEGEPGAGVARSRGETMVIGYESLPRFVDLEPAVFTRYLDEEGLRDRARPAGESIRDTYSRAAKAILRGTGDGEWAKPLGLEMEIVPLSSPFADGAVTFEVAFQGKPLAGTLLVALRRGAEVRARTDDAGRATLELAGHGTWLVKSVHIDCARTTSCRSWWASLTFER